MPFQKGNQLGKKFQKGHKICLGRKLSEESKKKIGIGILNAHKERPEIREKQRLARLGIPAWNRGISCSEEIKEKIRKSLLGHSHSLETRKKMRLSRLNQPRYNFRNEKHPNWKGGISREPYSIDWTDTLKKSIRERDHYVCQLCLKDGYPVHHIDYNKKNCNPDNLITLCNSCNSKVNFNRDYWTNYFNIIINNGKSSTI